MSLERDELALGRDELALGSDEVTLGRDELASGRDELALGRNELALGRDEFVLESDESVLRRDEFVLRRDELLSGERRMIPQLLSSQYLALQRSLGRRKEPAGCRLQTADCLRADCRRANETGREVQSVFENSST